MQLISSEPETILYKGTLQKPFKETIDQYRKVGWLNLERLLVEDKISLNDTPVSKEWFHHYDKIQKREIYFTGQVLNGKPNGFIRC